MSQALVFHKDDLINLKREHDAFVGIDSDGCVFPTMEIKQKQCFHKLIVSQWRLEKIERYVRESAEFANLYSKYRGRNRFPCLLLSIDLIRKRPEVLAAGVKLPAFTSLKKFIESGVPLGNPALEKLVRETGDEELASILKWSKEVNAEIARTVKNVPPFKWVRESLDQIRAQADAICVS
ncbi:MAG: HAD family hydrolase, partial [Kiritimatiellae bacterium]|nr:HAD family hydrolase [Kiritimatiellia bacterium]